MSTSASCLHRTAGWSSGFRAADLLGRYGRADAPPSLIYRRARAFPPQPPRETKTVYNTVRQVVMHFHQSTYQYAFHRVAATNYLRQEAFVFLLPQARPREDELDSMRPTRTARQLLRIFSKESAHRELRPFYSSVVRNVLMEEQERYKSRPSQAIALIWNLFGRQHAFRTLTRFYMGAVEKLGSNYYPALGGANALYLAAGVVLHSRVYQRYVRQLWSGEPAGLPLRYAHQEQPVSDDLLRLSVARRVLPARETLEQLAGTEQAEKQGPPAQAAEQGVHLSDSDFRALVQGVASSLGRQARLETLRRGGM